MPSLSTTSRPSSPKEGLLLQLKAKLLACFGDTTAHGYGRLANADSRPQRWFWVLVCAAALAAFSQQLYVITKQYTSKPLKTRASIGHEEKLAFPQVTICNLNMIRRSHIPDDIVAVYPEILGGRSKRRNASSTTKKSSLGSSLGQAVPTLDELPEEEILTQNVLEKLGERAEETLMTFGHQLKDMILDCQYSRLECLDDPDMLKYWTQFWHTRYGNCYTFNKGVDENGSDTTVMTSSQPGVGLILEINIEQDEYISQLSQEAGVRVFIGGQKEMPFPYEQGLSVSPGFATAIQLRKVIIGRLDPFHNRSCESRTNQYSESIFGRYDVTYTATACKVSCLVTMMNSSCGCVIFELKYSGDMPVCKTEDANTVTCVNTVYDRFDNGSCNSLCKDKCREDVFKTTVSLAKWPSSQFKETLDSEIEEGTSGNHSGETSDHFLKLKVYYGELNFEVIEEEEAYSMASFLSDIGGLMGMWIGISVLTIVELLELIVTLFIATLKMYSKRKNRVINIKNTDRAVAD